MTMGIPMTMNYNSGTTNSLNSKCQIRPSLSVYAVFWSISSKEITMFTPGCTFQFSLTQDIRKLPFNSLMSSCCDAMKKIICTSLLSNTNVQPETLQCIINTVWTARNTKKHTITQPLYVIVEFWQWLIGNRIYCFTLPGPDVHERPYLNPRSALSLL